jgi:membrane protease YdiL (CAAX protease family)
LHEKIEPAMELAPIRHQRWKQVLWLVGMCAAFLGASYGAGLLARQLRLDILPSVSVGQLAIMLVPLVFAWADGGGFRNLGLIARWQAVDFGAMVGILAVHLIGSGITAVVLQAAGLLDTENMEAMTVFAEFGKMPAGSFLGMAFLLALQAGLGEELLFRGYLVTRLERLGLGAWPCIILSGLIFGLIHVPSGYGFLPSLSKAIWFGIPTGAYFWYRRNLGPLVLVHFFVDFVSFMTLYMAMKLNGGVIPGM